MSDPRPESTTGLKVLAVAMAIALWGFVDLSQHGGAPDQSRRFMAVAIDVKHPPARERVRLLPAFAELSIEGPAKAVSHLTEYDVLAFVDLHYRQPAENRAPVMVSVPEGMKYQVIPDFVGLEVVPVR